MLTAKFGVVFFGQASGVIWLPEVCPIELAKLRRMAGTGIERSASQNSTAMCSKPSSCYAPANLPLRYQSVARPHGRTIGVEPFGFRPIPRLQKRRQGTSCIGSLAGNGARPRVCAGESREKSSPGPGCFEKRSGPGMSARPWCPSLWTRAQRAEIPKRFAAAGSTRAGEPSSRSKEVFFQ